MRAQIDALTGIRGYAALWVVLFHLHIFESWNMVTRGYWAVDIFFVLSGFIIAYVYESEFLKKPTWLTYKNYLWGRFGRLYPLHLITFLALLLLTISKNLLGMPIGNPRQFDVSGAVESLLLIHSWGVTDRYVWNLVSWSISAEFFAYLFLFPLYCWLFKRLPKWLMGVFTVVLWALVYRIAIHLEGSVNLSYNFGVLLIIPEFLGGYWLFKVRNQLPTSPLLNTLFFGASIIGMHFLAMQNTTYEILLLPLIMLLLVSLLGKGLHLPLFTNRFNVYLGKISYSLYMTHYIVWTAIDQATRYLPKIIGVKVEIPAFVAIVIMLAVASVAYHLVEEPARHWVRKKFVTIPSKGR